MSPAGDRCETVVLEQPDRDLLEVGDTYDEMVELSRHRLNPGSDVD